MGKHIQGLLPGLFVLACLGVNCQAVKIGEKLQSLSLSNIVYYDQLQVNLEAYKGKHIILEFWTKTCAVCIKSFPKLVQLQNKYRDKVQIIAINPDTKEETKKILARQKLPMGVIPFVTEDSTLQKFFPKNYVPWVVWIDDSGIVSHISDGAWLSDENIGLFVNGEQPKLVENVFKEASKTGVGFFAQGDESWKDQVVYYSYLSHCIKGRSIRNLTLQDSSQSSRITRNCKSAEELFKEAFGEGRYNRFGYAQQVILQVRDPYSFTRPKASDTAWLNRYSYNYEISVPSSPGSSIYKMMQDDLQKVFRVRAEIRREKIQAAVLVRVDSIDRMHSKGGDRTNNFFEEFSEGKTFARNTAFADFVSMLQVLYSPRNSTGPLLDATGYKASIDIELDKIDFEKPDLSSLKKSLNQFGLDIVMKDVEAEVLLITEN